MKIDVLSKNYINEEEQTMLLEEVEEMEKKINEEKEKLHYQELVERLFLELLNATPSKEDGTWSVGTCLCYGNSRYPKENRITEEEKKEIEFFKDFLTMCDFNFTITNSSFSYNVIYVKVSMTLEERDELEEYLKSQNDTKVLSKIKYK